MQRQARKKRKTSFSTFNSRSSPVVEPASTSNAQFQPQPLMPSVDVFSFRWLNTGTCFASGKPSHWHSCCPAMAKQASLAPNWLDEGLQTGAVCFKFLCRNLIFEAECRNVNQERLNVSSFFCRHTISFGLVQGLWGPVDFSIVPSVRGRLFKCINLWHTLLVSCSFWMLLARATKFPSSSFLNLFTEHIVPPTVNSSFLSKAVNRLLSFNLVPESFTFLTLFTRFFSSTLVFILDSTHIYAFFCWQKI